MENNETEQKPSKDSPNVTFYYQNDDAAKAQADDIDELIKVLESTMNMRGRSTPQIAAVAAIGAAATMIQTVSSVISSAQSIGEMVSGSEGTTHHPSALQITFENQSDFVVVPSTLDTSKGDIVQFPTGIGTGESTSAEFTYYDRFTDDSSLTMNLIIKSKTFGFEQLVTIEYSYDDDKKNWILAMTFGDKTKIFEPAIALYGAECTPESSTQTFRIYCTTIENEYGGALAIQIFGVGSEK